MRKTDFDIFSKYVESRRLVQESSEEAFRNKMMGYAKALGHLEGVLIYELQRLKGAQVELNSPEINRAIKSIQDGLNSAKQMTETPPAETKQEEEEKSENNTKDMNPEEALQKYVELQDLKVK